MILLRARTPVTYREIREQFSAYQTLNAEAGLRAFERDKADLLELGVPIRYVTPDEDDSLEDGGYVIDLKRFKMPEVRLTADEISALVLAASVAHAMPGGAYPKIVDLALKKLAFDLPDLPDTPTEFPRRVSPVLVHFPERTIADAPRQRARRDLRDARIRHAPAQARDDDLSSRGDGDDQQARSRSVRAGLSRERVARRRLVPPAQGDPIVPRRSHSRGRCRRPSRNRRTSSGPLDFDIKSYAQRSPWTFTTDPAEEVQLALAAAAAEVANEDFGPDGGEAPGRRPHADHVRLREPRVRDDAHPRRKGAIAVMRGDRLRARIAEELDAIALHYRETLTEQVPGDA